jgi:drug/metabolite transporter (DMT)-like permease
MANGETLIGIAAAAAAAACFDGAIVLQAREARTVPLEHGLQLSLLRRLVARRRWVVATAIAVLGWPLQLVAYALAPVTVVQPTLALGTLLLLAVGTRALGEHVGRREWTAAAAIVTGVAALAIGAPPHTNELGSFTAVATPMALLALTAVVPYIAGPRRAGIWLLIAGAGCAFALSALAGKVLTVELANGRPWPALGVAAIAAAAAAAGFLIDMTALQRFDATRTSPPMFVLETAIPVALAPVMFEESWSAARGGGVLTAVGLGLVLVGGAVLGTSRSVTNAGESEDLVGGGGTPAIGEVGATR